MISKYRDGKVPDSKIGEENYIYAKRAGVGPDDEELAAVLEQARSEFVRHFDRFEFSHALEGLWRVISRVDKMITESAPWNLVKDEQQAQTLNAVLYRAVETLRWLTVLLAPVMPAACGSIWKQMGMDGSPLDVAPHDLEWGGLEAGNEIGKAEPVFPRLDSKKIMEAIDAQKEVEELDEQDFITIDDFFKVELRVGEVLGAENVPKSDKLLKCMVDVAEEEPRQILAGIAEHYKPEELVGKKVVVVCNLKPRKMMGLESQGMICAASLNKDDKPVVATFDEDVPNGARLT